MKDEYCYIEFEIGDLNRFASLQKIFAKLKQVKNDLIQDVYLTEKQTSSDYVDPVDNFQWRDYLDDEAIEWFDDTFDFNSEEGIIYWKLLELTDPEIRFQHPFFKTPGNWYFESMLDAIFNGDYSLIAVVKEQGDKPNGQGVSPDRRLATTSDAEASRASLRGCLYYNPRAYPFGGSGSLIELIESFGNKITYDSWQKKKNPSAKSEWNFELAKKLVTKGIGFTPELLQN